MNNNLTPRRDNSTSAINTALRLIHAPDPNYEIRVTVDGERVNVAAIRADDTGMFFTNSVRSYLFRCVCSFLTIKYFRSRKKLRILISKV